MSVPFSANHRHDGNDLIYYHSLNHFIIGFIVNLDPALLRAFIAVTEAGGFTKAARRLNLTQSAISHQIRRLEEEVGRLLLYRTTRALTLTEDGADFLRYATQILDAMQAVTQRFHSSPASGVVRFGAPDIFMGERLPVLLTQFSRAFPNVRLDVSVGMSIDSEAMVDAQELDLAVVLCVRDHKRKSGDEGIVLRRTRFVWVAAESVELREGASLPMAFFPAPCVNRRVAVETLDALAVDWHVAFTSSSQSGIRAAVMAGLGVTVFTRDDLEPGIAVIDGQYGLPALPEAEFRLLWGKGEKTLAAKEFGRLVLDTPVERPLRTCEARTA
ncbi:LysR family transcriptional regulator [Caballeronia sordidicola]|uniref:LysR family transcriptional regulator n=1 Tax=Caballeronia sordidicola TaxID=196367 RepID=A0A158GKZ0_CABSO|nr:LysR family transcriptional regulator [Caballeronia sordidicola]